MSRQALWSASHTERAALADDLAELAESQWSTQSLCGSWTVQHVVAHLTAAGSIGRWRWMASNVGARFDADLHNQRRLREHLGSTPGETLERFRQVITSTTAASGHTAAWLGEVIVHATDIRRPLGLAHAPDVEATTEVARFFAQRNFTVASKSAIKGLRMEATDGPFNAGSGPLVSGTTLALTMAMAGRDVFYDELSGPGVATLRSRQVTADAGQ